MQSSKSNWFEHVRCVGRLGGALYSIEAYSMRMLWRDYCTLVEMWRGRTTSLLLPSDFPIQAMDGLEQNMIAITS